MTSTFGGSWLLAVVGYVGLAGIGAAACFLVRRRTPLGGYRMSYRKAVVLAIAGGWLGGTLGGPLARTGLRTLTTEAVRDRPILWGTSGAIVGAVLASLLHLWLYGPQRRRRRAEAIKGVFFGAAALSLLISILILVALFTNAWDFLSQVVWEQVLGVSPWSSSDGAFGLDEVLLAGVVVLGIALVVALPLGFLVSRFVARGVHSIFPPLTVVVAVLAGGAGLGFGFLVSRWAVPRLLDIVGDVDAADGVWTTVALVVGGVTGLAATANVLRAGAAAYPIATATLRLLAGAPLLALGFVGIQWAVPQVMGDDASRTALVVAGGLALGLGLVPRVAALSEDLRRTVLGGVHRAGAGRADGADGVRPPGLVHTAGHVLRPTLVPAVGLAAALVGLALLTDSWFFETEWSRIFDGSWNPRQDSFGITTILMGSLIVTVVAMVVAAPLGLGAAIYLSEYARPRVRALLKPILEVLAGVPSVVLGFFALQWIAPQVVGRLFGEEAGRGGSMMAAGIGVGVLVVPLMASVSEDAMRAVPDSLRDASAGLGARKIATTVKVVLPAAVSGIVAAFVLATSRAVGETMVVYIAGGASDTAPYTADPVDSSLTMTAAMASLAVGTDNVRGAGLAVPSLYFVGIALFAFTLGLNLIGNRFVRRVREAY